MSKNTGEFYMRSVVLVQQWLAQGLRYRRDLVDNLRKRFEIDRSTAYRVVATALNVLGREITSSPAVYALSGAAVREWWTPERRARHSKLMKAARDPNRQRFTTRAAK